MYLHTRKTTQTRGCTKRFYGANFTWCRCENVYCRTICGKNLVRLLCVNGTEEPEIFQRRWIGITKEPHMGNEDQICDSGPSSTSILDIGSHSLYFFLLGRDFFVRFLQAHAYCAAGCSNNFSRFPSTIRNFTYNNGILFVGDFDEISARKWCEKSIKILSRMHR